MTCPIEYGPFVAGSLGITDNDTAGIDHITGPDIVANIVMDVSDKTCDILPSYGRIPAAEATGCNVGDTVSRLGTVVGVD